MGCSHQPQLALDGGHVPGLGNEISPLSGWKLVFIGSLTSHTYYTTSPTPPTAPLSDRFRW